MISMTTKNGNVVRLSADYQLDVETVEYSVSCGRYVFYFPYFKPAAKVYKELSRRIEDGLDISDYLECLVNSAHNLGFRFTCPLNY